MSISLEGIDWTAPVVEIIDELTDRYQEAHPRAEIEEVEEWAERVCFKRIKALAPEHVGRV